MYNVQYDSLLLVWNLQSNALRPILSLKSLTGSHLPPVKLMIDPAVLQEVIVPSTTTKCHVLSPLKDVFLFTRIRPFPSRAVPLSLRAPAVSSWRGAIANKVALHAAAGWWLAWLSRARDERVDSRRQFRSVWYFEIFFFLPRFVE